MVLMTRLSDILFRKKILDLLESVGRFRVYFCKPANLISNFLGQFTLDVSFLDKLFIKFINTQILNFHFKEKFSILKKYSNFEFLLSSWTCGHFWKFLMWFLISLVLIKPRYGFSRIVVHFTKMLKIWFIFLFSSACGFLVFFVLVFFCPIIMGIQNDPQESPIFW